MKRLATTQPTALERRLEGLAALDEPVRRDLYFHVSRQGGEVSRDEAAQALGISRALAAFHLDKLVQAGILDVAFRRLSGRKGPGAGRPSKLYRRSTLQLEASLPERRYELAGRWMARAIAGAGASDPRSTLRDSARTWGERAGEEARGRSRAHQPERALERAIALLRETGFEPRRDGEGGVILENCPFQSLACESPALVCGMNQALVQGMVTGLGLEGMSARLEPKPGRCCVTLRPSSAPDAPSQAV